MEIFGKTLVFYCFYLAYFLYALLVHPGLLTSLTDKLYISGSQVYLSLTFLLNAIFYLATALLMGFMFYLKKSRKHIVVEVIAVDIPILFLSTMYVQYDFLYTFSYTKNWQFYTQIGFLLLGVEVLRYIHYFHYKKTH